MRRFPFERAFGFLLDAITILTGLVLIAIAFEPRILTWLGFNLTPGEGTAFVRGMLVVAAWFIFARDGVTRTVSEINKSGPIAFIIVALILLAVFGRALYLAMVAAGLFDEIVMISVATALLAVGAIWTVKTYKRRP